MKAKLGKKHYKQIHAAMRGRIGSRRGALVVPLKRKSAWQLFLQAQKVAKIR